MKSGDNFDVSDLDPLDMQEEGSDFDLRYAELEMFTKMYQKLLDMYWRSIDGAADGEQRAFLSTAKAIFSSFKRYVRHDDELFEEVEEVEDEVSKLIIDLDNGVRIDVGYMTLDEIKEVIENMRHEANLKMPQKTSVGEDDAWRKSV